MKCNICIPTVSADTISEEFTASVGEDSFLEFECDEEFKNSYHTFFTRPLNKRGEDKHGFFRYRMSLSNGINSF